MNVYINRQIEKVRVCITKLQLLEGKPSDASGALAASTAHRRVHLRLPAANFYVTESR